LGPTSTAVEIAHLSLMKAADAFVSAALLEMLVSPDDQSWPARKWAAVGRECQDALIGDAKAGTTDRLDDLWARLYPEEHP
jgi:hypothetical protein